MTHPRRPAALLCLALGACTAPGDPGPGEPVDLIPHARLTASATRPVEDLLWPREAEDAIATVRDGHDHTGWKVPLAAPATVTIDLLPWLGQHVQLDRLAVDFAEARPAALEVAIRPACGRPAAATHDWTDLDTPLELDGASGGCVTLTVPATTEPLALTGLELISRDRAITLPRWSLETLPPVATRFPGSGVIEGFYGVPWSWRERAHAVLALGAWGLDRYLYAPKHDPRHRDEWRTPYPEADRTRFADLAALAEGAGVALLMGISPLVDYDVATDADYTVLRDKLERFLDLGLQGVALLADDIEFELVGEVDAALGREHVALANRLHADLRTVREDLVFWFVPTVYSDERARDWAGGEGYLAALADLDPGIEVVWTGPGTSNETLRGGDLAAVTAAAERAPLIWDNHWANDGGDGFFGRLLLGPFTGRDADTLAATAGMAHNPMIQGALSRLDLGAFVQYLEQPDATTPDAQRAAAAKAELRLALPGAGAGDAVLLTEITAVFDGDAQRTPGYRVMEDAIQALRARLDTSSLLLGDAETLLPLLAGLAALGSEVHHSKLSPDLVDELAFPLRKARHMGEMGLWTLALLGARLAADQGTEAWKAAEEAADLASLDRFTLSPGKVRALLDDVIALPPADRGFVAPSPDEPAPASCRAGAPLSWSPYAGNATRGVRGLPGAAVADGLITWTPPHGGTYRAIVWATTDSGWAFQSIELACLPQ